MPPPPPRPAPEQPQGLPQPLPQPSAPASAEKGTPPRGTPAARGWFDEFTDAADEQDADFGPTGQPTEIPYRFKK